MSRGHPLRLNYTVYVIKKLHTVNRKAATLGCGLVLLNLQTYTTINYNVLAGDKGCIVAD